MSESLEQRLAYLEGQVSVLTKALGEKEKKEKVRSLTDNLISGLQNLGPIQSLIEDETVNDILINGHKKIFVERKGRMEATDVQFPDESSVLTIAEQIVEAVGRRINPARPLVDARLIDGSRVNIIAPPLAVDGTSISIRKFAKRVITIEDMKATDNVSDGLGEFLKICGKCRLNVIVSGGTGSGKTTLLNAVSQHIEDYERVVSIEDAAELKLHQPNLVRLETKPVTFDGDREEEVSIRDLVKNALRMRPDRIIVGEVRGPEAFDMMQAMNTGHEGSLTTIHANHPRDAISRLENMINTANLNLPISSIRQQISSAIHLIIQISRMRDGHRRVTFVSEIVGMEGDTITMQDLFMYVPSGDGPDGKMQGQFKWSGIMPRFVRRVAYYGELPRLEVALGVKLPKI